MKPQRYCQGTLQHHSASSGLEAVFGTYVTGSAGGELIRRAEYITPVKKNAFGPREAYTEEEHRCRRRGEGGFDVHVCAYTRQVMTLPGDLLCLRSSASSPTLA